MNQIIDIKQYIISKLLYVLCTTGPYELYVPVMSMEGVYYETLSILWT